jgi:hypothetical protein
VLVVGEVKLVVAEARLVQMRGGLGADAVAVPEGWWSQLG